MDETVQKLHVAAAPEGEMGQRYLASGDRLAMRLWRNESPTYDKARRTRPYETVGYVLSGMARLHVGDETLVLREGDSWVVPADAPHTYEILERFSALEATAPPARAGHDEPVS